MKMTTSQKAGLAIVFAAVVFLLVAAYGILPGLIALSGIIVRTVLLAGAIAVVRTTKPKPRGQ
jgi:hypothetical protein